MKKIKVREAEGPVLDWLVARAEGWVWKTGQSSWFGNEPWLELYSEKGVIRETLGSLDYSTNWAQGGPIIDENRVQFRSEQRIQYRAFMGQYGPDVVGPTHLIAAMRCYVISKLGEEVEVPDALT